MKTFKYLLRDFSSCLTAITILICSTLNSYADQTTDEGFTYTVLPGGTAVEITGYEPSDAESVNIPSHIDGKRVVSIGFGAFAYHYQLKDVSFPDTLLRIGDWAFYDSRIETATLPENLSSLGRGAFAMCLSLESVFLPDGLTSIENHTFVDCSNLSRIDEILPNGFTYEGLPRSIAYIGDSAFSNCFSLKTIKFRGNAPELGIDVFDRFSTTVRYPSNRSGFTSPTWGGVPSIEVGPIREQIKLGKITLQYVEYDTYIDIIDYRGHTDIFSIPESLFGKPVTVIRGPRDGGRIHKRSKRFSTKSLIIPETISLLDDEAFSYLRGLEEIRFKGDAPELGVDVFKGTNATVYYRSNRSGFTSPTWQGLPSVSEDVTGTFVGDGFKLTYVEYENDIEITEFKGDPEKTLVVTVPDTIKGKPVTSIKQKTFSRSGLVSITLPEGLSYIGHYAFAHCSNLESVFFLGDAPYLGHRIFLGVPSGATVHYYSNKTGFTSPKWGGIHSVSEDVTGTFVGDGFELTYVEYENDIEIAEFKEDPDKALTVTIPGTIENKPVTSIGKEAFEGSRSLISITLPEEITYIGASAFDDCRSLEKVYFLGNAPNRGHRIFRKSESHVTVYYWLDKTGFTSPKWADVRSIGSFPIFRN